MQILRRCLGIVFSIAFLGLTYCTTPASTLTRMRVPISEIAVIAPSRAPDQTSVLIQADLTGVPVNTKVLLALVSLDFGAVNTLEDKSVLQLELLPIGTEWESGTVTWNYPWDTPGGDVNTRFRERYSIRGAGRARFDITELVQSWSDGSLENHGILIRVSSYFGGTFSLDALPAQRGPVGLFLILPQSDE